MRFAWWANLLCLCAVTAGCVGEDAANTGLGGPDAQADASSGAAGGNETGLDLANVTLAPAIPAEGLAVAANGCTGASVALAIPIEDVQAALPEGYEAADGPVYTGPVFVPPPTKTGKGLVSVEIIQCLLVDLPGWSGPAGFASILAHILPPPASTELAPVGSEYYELGKFATEANLVRLLASVGYEVHHVSIEAESYVIPVGPSTGDGAVLLDGKSLYDVHATSLVAQRFLDWTRRVWHETPQGVLHADYQMETTIHHGPLAECSFAEPVLQRSTCAPGEVWDGLSWDSSALGSRLFFVPRAP